MTYEIAYEQKQGVPMRILTEMSRRGLDLNYVIINEGNAVIVTDANAKQQGQLERAWRAIIGVEKVAKRTADKQGRVVWLQQ